LNERAVNDVNCLKNMNKDNYQNCGQLILSDEDLAKRAAGMTDKEILADKMK
jgi:hypothetical protein